MYEVKYAAGQVIEGSDPLVQHGLVFKAGDKGCYWGYVDSRNNMQVGKASWVGYNGVELKNFDSKGREDN